MAMSDKPAVHVRALYDYEYTFTDGSDIAIKSGEEFILQKKATNEWWLVKKIGGNDIYVPSNYVEEIHKTVITLDGGEQPHHAKPRAAPPPPPKPKFSMIDHALSGLDKAISLFDENDDVTTHEDVSDNKNRNSITSSWNSGMNGDSLDKRSQKTEDSADSEPEVDYEEALTVNTEKLNEQVKSAEEIYGPESGADNNSPENTILRDSSIMRSENQTSRESKAEVRQSCMGKVKTGIGKFELPQYENLTELRGRVAERPGEEEVKLSSPDSEHGEASDDLPDYANVTQILQARQVQPKSLSSSTEDDLKVKDDKSRRRSAPPPSLPPIPMYRREDSTQSDIGELPAGWEQEITEAGEVFYINPTTQEKWQTSQDKTGRPYFYSTDGSTSSWSLPEPQRKDRLFSLPVTLTVASSSQISSPTTLIEDDSGSLGGDVASRISTLSANTKNQPLRQAPGHPKNASSLIEGDSSSLGRDVASRISTLDQNLVAGGLAGTMTGSQKRPAPEVPKPVEKSGMLNKAKVMENGKKIKKNWSQSWVITAGSKLLFYKDQKAVAPKGNSAEGKPEFVIDLQGATVEFGTKEQRTSKKNVIQVQSSSGTVCMLQSDDSISLHSWLMAIKQNISSVGKSASTDQTQKSTSSDLSILRGKSRRGGKEVGKLEETGEKKKVKDKLLMWLKRRPTLESLQESGIYNTNIFGSHLHTICEREGTTIPTFVTNCVNIIEKKGLNADGIYRLSGNQSDIQKLRFYVDQDEHYDLSNPEWDIHVLTGALKLFFRELMEPVVPFRFLERFIKAMQIKDQVEKQKQFRDDIRLLPDCNRDTIRFFFGHLVKVLKHSQDNRMQAHSLAIVFGPTLMWAENNDSPTNMAVYQTNMVYQGQIVEYLLLEYQKLQL